MPLFFVTLLQIFFKKSARWNRETFSSWIFCVENTEGRKQQGQRARVLLTVYTQ